MLVAVALRLQPGVLVTSAVLCVCLLFHTQLMAFPSVSLCVPQASSGVKQWNKRWFVLVDRCLFYYKGEFAQRCPAGAGEPRSTLSCCWALLWKLIGRWISPGSFLALVKCGP